MCIPWVELPEQAKKFIIEERRKLKWFTLNNTQHLVTPKPSSVLGKPNPTPQQVHFHDNYPSPDNPPQDHVISMIPPAPQIVWMNPVH